MNIGVTGTNGYLGNCVSNYFKIKKQTVYSFSRKHNDEEDDLNFNFSLVNGIDKNILSKLDVLIHCAYDFSVTSWEDILRINVEGTKSLFDDAYEVGVKKTIFISTMSSYPSCKSKYGQAKQIIEKHIKQYNSIIIKPGLIYGERAGGMIGSIQKTINSWPLIPVVGGKKVLYLIHIGDLCGVIEDVLEIDNAQCLEIIAANKYGKKLKNIVRQLILISKKNRLIIPIPYYFTYFILLFIEKLNFNIGFRSDSLLSLYNQDNNPDFSFLNSRLLNLRDFNC